ncbi:MAG: hypothetical protein AAGD28_24085, partial [Bacteroidota bacterium]
MKKNRKIDWLNHALEFMVVLIGILIAFQLNECSENSSKRKLISNHLVQIEAECQGNSERLGLAIDQIEVQIKVCDSLLSAISQASNPESIRNFSTKLLDLRNVDISKNAYSVLVQSGDIRFLKDFE